MYFNTLLALCSLSYLLFVVVLYLFFRMVKFFLLLSMWGTKFCYQNMEEQKLNLMKRLIFISSPRYLDKGALSSISLATERAPLS